MFIGAAFITAYYRMDKKTPVDKSSPVPQRKDDGQDASRRRFVKKLAGASVTIPVVTLVTDGTTNRALATT